MPISDQDTLPDVQVIAMGEHGPEAVALSDRLKGRKVALFGMPGAFTGTCTGSHMPSILANMAGFKEKGVDEVIVLVVNDPFVTQAWADSTGAAEAGVSVLADPESNFALATDTALTVPPVGFFNRLQRIAILSEDGVATKVLIEDSPGTSEATSAEALLAAM